MDPLPLERFEPLVADALDRVPEGFAMAVDNVAFLVADHAEGRSLLGLYEGIPLTKRGNHYGGAMPDRITLFRETICAACASEEEVRELVYTTIVHELGHYFGMTDGALRAHGY